VTNTDVVLNRNALITLWRFLEERQDVGVCAPRITYADGRDQGMLFHHSLFSHYATWYAKALARYAKSKIASATAPLKVHGVTGAFFLIRRRSVFALPILFDEDFLFYHEDTSLAHALKKRGVSCFVIPDATIIHIGGKSSSAASVSLFYRSKYLYLRKFYGPLHARAIYFLDRLRILRKLLFYSLLSLLVGSERIKSKQRHYKVAWSAAFLK
jgi:GT2 family glycosyltransferase